MAPLARLLDTACAVYSARRRLFADGAGDPEAFAWASSVVEGPPGAIAVRWLRELRDGQSRFLEGVFESPVADRLPPASRIARVELILPAGGRGAAPVCLHLAATGEQSLARRRHLVARPLLARGIGALLLENPFYGGRRPPGQDGAAVRTVAGLGVMARAAAEEGRSLLAWVRAEGHELVGVSGVSMGGQVAAMVAASVPFDVAVALCVPSRTPATVFTSGELARMVDWAALERCWGAGARARLAEWLDAADLLRLPPPRRCASAVIIAGEADAILPGTPAADIHRHWPGSELRLLPTGHVGAYLFHLGELHRAVADAFARLRGAAERP